VTVLELAAALAAGGVAGWAGHTLYRWARAEPPSPAAAELVPREGSDSSPTVSEPSTSRPPPRRVSEGASAAGRVILHLYTQGRLAPHEVADPEFTQQGIGGALGLRQGTVARVVGRLMAVGVLEGSRRHVTGRPRRLTVYTLTPLGESVARDLRKRPVDSFRAPGPNLGSAEPPVPGRGGG
jgi:DNA-binding MarR family transcriptional regulator